MWREHGMVFLGSYTVAYAANFGACWGAIVVAKMDGIELLRKCGVDKAVDTSKWSPNLVNAFISMTLADLMEPVRLPLVIMATPFLSRALRRGRS